MNITLSSQERENYLFIESKGTVETVEELIEQSRMVYEEICKHNFQKILVYEVDTHLPMDLVPQFDLVKNYAEEFPPEIQNLKIAVVVSETYKEVGATWETLCQSRGLQYFNFTSLQEAIDCLNE